MEKTIKQLADELGVTKQTVQYHFRSLPTKYSYKNDKGIFVLYDEGQEIIRNKINKFADKETAKETVRNDKENSDEIFLKQLEKKDEQIKSLLENQKHLQKLLDQQQILTLQANKKIEELELLNAPVEEKKSRSFIQKFFRKE